MKALVYRKRGKAWEFTPNVMYHRLCHITRAGTIYGIFLDDAGIKPVWIGRRIDGTWVTWEGVRAIHWVGNGWYYFPIKTRG